MKPNGASLLPAFALIAACSVGSDDPRGVVPEGRTSPAATPSWGPGAAIDVDDGPRLPMPSNTASTADTNDSVPPIRAPKPLRPGLTTSTTDPHESLCPSMTDNHPCEWSSTPGEHGARCCQ